jgi:hypothetical protein
MARRGRWDLEPAETTIPAMLQAVADGDVVADTLFGKRAKRMLRAPRRGLARQFLAWQLYYGNADALRATRAAICGE